jgi:AcrR family transcriptional regulator
MAPLSKVKPASSRAGSRPALAPRERIVRSAAQLIRRQGVSGAGMREIVLQADAPRGSLQHYFPSGKEELVGEALLWMGGVAARRVRRHLAELDPATPSALLAALVDDWRADLTNEDFQAGCPLVAAAADVLATSEELRRVLRQAFDGWQEPLTAALVELDVPADRAEGLAMVVISALEGAIVFARVRGDLLPLDAVVSALGPLLDESRSVRSGA